MENSVRKQQLIAANSSHSVVGVGVGFGVVRIPAFFVVVSAWGFINFGVVFLPALIVVVSAWGFINFGEVFIPAFLVIFSAWEFIVSVSVIAFTFIAVGAITVVLTFAIYR